MFEPPPHTRYIHTHIYAYVYVYVNACGRYIIAVNSSVVSDTGGTCVCTADPNVDRWCINDPAYAICKAEVKRDLITATAAIAAFATFFMGLLANL